MDTQFYPEHTKLDHLEQRGNLYFQNSYRARIRCWGCCRRCRRGRCGGRRGRRNARLRRTVARANFCKSVRRGWNRSVVNFSANLTHSVDTGRATRDIASRLVCRVGGRIGGTDGALISKEGSGGLRFMEKMSYKLWLLF